MRALFFTYLLGILLVSGTAAAQTVPPAARFMHITTKDGLSQSSVFSITQDHLDLVWIGTRDGLNRYDARRFITYRNTLSDSTSLSDNYVTALLEDNTKRLWVGTAQGVNLYDRNKDQFVRLSLLGGAVPEPLIYAIVQDRSGVVWFCSSAGLFVLKSDGPKPRAAMVFNGRNIANKSLPAGSRNVQHIYQDSRGRHWLSTTNGVYAFDGLVSGAVPKLVYEIKGGQRSLSSEDVRFVYEMSPGCFWMGTKEGGINVFEEKTGKFRYITVTGEAGKSISSNDVRTLVKDRQGGYWIGTINGLNYYDKASGFVSYVKDEHDGHSLADNSVRSIYQDRRGSIWVGTYYGGISIFDRTVARFRHYKKDGLAANLSYNVVSGIVADSNGGFWIGYEGGGLDYMDGSQKIVRHYRHRRDEQNGLSNNHVKSIYLDRAQNLWVGTYTGGLNLLRKGSQRFEHFRHDPEDVSSLSNNNVYAVAEDEMGNLWIGTYGGGINFKKAGTEGYFESYRSGREEFRLSSDLVRDVFIDSRQNLWVATENGLNVRWAGTDYFEVFQFHVDDPSSISSNIVLSIYEDSRKRLWIGTSKTGLNEFRYRTKDFRRVTFAPGVAGTNVVSMLEDNGILWLGTNNGIYAFDVEQGEISPYNTKDGLLGNEFAIGAAARSKKGDLLFGGTHGITAFYPGEITRSDFRPKMIFSEVRIHNKALSPQEGMLASHISLATSLTLTHRDNIISIDFSTLNFIIPEKNKYAYRLEGLEEEWNYVTTPTATYTNLAPGNYVLSIKGASNDGVWSKDAKQLRITVLPPWWRTWWAYVLYGTLVAFVLFVVLRFTRGRRELKYQLRLQQIEAANEKKVAEIKANFYTNISHELRTPLTLILGPLHHMLSETPEKDPHWSLLDVMRRNAQRLLHLVNELLESRKNELGLTRLTIGKKHISSLINGVLSSFQEDIRQKNVSVDLRYPDPEPPLWIDSFQMEKVFYNITANALRFVPQNGKLDISVRAVADNEEAQTAFLRVEIKDNGVGIPAAELPFIFELFYQAENRLLTKNKCGSGLGLSLAKEIVHLHGGKIAVQSCYNKEGIDSYTNFLIDLPLGRDHFPSGSVEMEHDEAHSIEAPSGKGESFVGTEAPWPPTELDDVQGRTLILIVDDNKEILSLLTLHLGKFYSIVTASDGEKGWEIAREQLPDIIVTDVMMPNLDGVSLARLVKGSEITSHIPVILLTALSSEQDMRLGMESGSDDYLAKPVNVELLLLKIQNTLYTRKHAKRRFIQQYMLEGPTYTPDGSEERVFLEKVISFIEERLSGDLNVMQLSSELGMSRPVLYKKIKQLTDLSIIELINVLRLRQATRLLGSGHMGISDIAYQVGYSDPKWFSKSFKAYYGITPTQFAALQPPEKARIIEEHKLFHILSR